MTEGKQRAARSMLVAQAALVWDDGKLDTQHFIETGSFGDTGGDVLKFDANARAAFVAQFEGKG